MVKKSRERRLEIFKYRYRDVRPGDVMARGVGKFRHSLRSKDAKNRDTCVIHSKIEKEVTGKWIFEPGSSDVKGIDVPAAYVHGYTRKSKIRGNPPIKVRAHYRLTKKFPKYCKGDKIGKMR